MNPQKRDIIFIAIAIVVILGLLAWFFIAKPKPHLPTSIPGNGTSTSSTASGPQASIPNNNAAATPLTENAQYYTISLQYPSATPLASTAGASADATAVASMKTFTQSTASTFISENNLNNLPQAEIQAEGLDQGRQYSMSDQYSYYSSPFTVSYVFPITEDTLGAHPNLSFQTFTFDAKTGTKLALSDLFTPGSDYVTALENISRTMLTAQLGDMADTTMLDPGTSSAANFANFALDGQNLVLIFAPYQVAAYAAGPQTIKIPLSQLSSILKPQYQ